ncbi:MAG: arginine--tRNA ligase [Bdellovibrionales bacterium]|nr:arginine--tRNA ligase [Bdellovibrionales bacterium]
MERFKNPLVEALSKALNELFPGVVEEVLKRKIGPQDLETPPDRALGDFAFPCFRLSKQLKKAPPQISQELTAKVAPLVDPAIFEVKQAGPYVNFICNPKALIDGVLKDVLSAAQAYGTVAPKSREKWVFEYSSPNVAKPFQIYHLRTTIVGNSLSKMARLRGYDVTTINHLGDWGTQYGKLAYAIKKYANELPKEIALKDLVDIYVRIHKDMETDPQIEKDAQALFLKLEQGDADMRAIWKKCVDISMREFEKTYAKFNVKFDHYWGESFYEPQLKPLLADLKKRKVLVEDKGAWIVPVTTRAGGEIPPTILEKSDGATIYATRDVAAAIYRKEHLNFDRMTYIVGKEQILHFEQVFGVLRAMGLAWESQLEHLPTGLYRFKDAKMSTRKGNFITLEEVLELCSERSLTLMKERNATLEADQRLSDADIETIADQVSVGAIAFADLSTDPTRDLDFDVNRVVAFEGETGPYLQYAHTRCLSILKKVSATASPSSAELATKLTSSFELNLIRQLGRFPEAIERSLDQRKPSQLATYLINLTNDFNSFYRECKVMNPDDAALTAARASLVVATKNVLGHGLDLLGIPKPDKM